jgi:hypothetical protein
VQQRINNLSLAESKPLQEKLAELVAIEARLAYMVLGTSYTNELGIVVPAREPILR